ncbi:hypothetical protein GC197_07945 [bacterium]|nr:hypothetical protein [bacterium]
MKIDKPTLRSAKYQGLLIIGVLFGAACLAVTALFLREIFFEKYVRETFQPVAEHVAARAKSLATSRLAAETNPVTNSEIDALYDAWIQTDELDSSGMLANHLFEINSEHMLARCCRTLVIGNQQQRLQALKLLEFAPATEHADQVRQLAEYAREKSKRRAEDNLVTAADGLLARLPQGKTP